MNPFKRIAKRLATNPGFSCCEIGKDLGFESQAAFVRYFRPANSVSETHVSGEWFNADNERCEWEQTALCFAAAMRATGDL